MNVPFLNSLKASSSSSRLFITMGPPQTIGSFREEPTTKGNVRLPVRLSPLPVRPYLLQEREQNIIWHNPYFPQIAVSLRGKASLPANREIGFHHRVLRCTSMRRQRAKLHPNMLSEHTNCPESPVSPGGCLIRSGRLPCRTSPPGCHPEQCPYMPVEPFFAAGKLTHSWHPSILSDGCGISLWSIPEPAVIHWHPMDWITPLFPRLSSCSIVPLTR